MKWKKMTMIAIISGLQSSEWINLYVVKENTDDTRCIIWM